MVQRRFFKIQVKNDAKHQQPEFPKTNLLIFNTLPRQLDVKIDVKTQKRPTLIMSKSFENADLLSFLAKCIQAPLRGACTTAFAVYTRIVMRQPASKLASAAHTPLCTSLSFRADNREQDVLWTSVLHRPERSGDLGPRSKVSSA